jgi:hypothetical protein
VRIPLVGEALGPVSGWIVDGAIVVVVHLEAMNHCLERRDVYRRIESVIVPDDGETITV